MKKNRFFAAALAIIIMLSSCACDFNSGMLWVDLDGESSTSNTSSQAGNGTKEDSEKTTGGESDSSFDESEITNGGSDECQHLNYESVVNTDATCDKSGSYCKICTDCNQNFGWVEIPPLGHDEGNWTVENSPTADKEGYRSTVCKRCGEKLVESIAPVGYSEGLGFLPNGDGTCTLASIGNCKDLYIYVPPTSPDGYTVVAVEDEAFNDFYVDYDIIGISLPDTVERIGNKAFAGCPKLEEVIMPNGLKVIGDHAFGSCFSLKDITIPEGVTEIGRYAFTNCTKLTKLYIPSSVESIGRGAIFAESIDQITVDPETDFTELKATAL